LSAARRGLPGRPASEGRTSIGDPEKGDPERFAVRTPSVSTYVTVTASLPMSIKGTGMHGLAELYPSLFVVDDYVFQVEIIAWFSL
jgi:hypothetical protein